MNRLRAVIQSIWHQQGAAHGEPTPDLPCLKAIISDIRSAEEHRIRRDLMPDVRRISASLSRGIPVPTLTICGKGTREIRFTQYLAWFMDPRNPHGLNDAVLRTVLRIGAPALYASVEGESLRETRVEAEYGIGSGQIDILCMGRAWALFIEQKIDAVESTDEQGRKQLEYYDAAIKCDRWRFLDIHKIFLTPGASAPSSGSTSWVPLSHVVLMRGLVPLLADSSFSDTARTNLRRLLMDLACGPADLSFASLQKLDAVARKLCTSKKIDIGAVKTFERLRRDLALSLEIITTGVSDE